MSGSNKDALISIKRCNLSFSRNATWEALSNVYRWLFQTATKVAKQNTQMVKKISQILREANIILFTVNHILDDPANGPFPKPAQISGLNPGERLPGGKTALYFGNNIFRLDDGGSLKEDQGFGINGQVVNVKIIKSRTNQNKRTVPIVFNKSEGGFFDPVLSMFYYLKSEGQVDGSGVGMYFEELPDVKFSQKEFKNKLNSNKELQAVFYKKCVDLLTPLLADTENKEATDEGFDFLSAMAEDKFVS